ncbi:hypothetical protein BDZ91DRAFT_831680 [Kalaharituber pfeilii]|nr:hypothetical protein BDZ91DRAFT_831680 [Kalaharituber pfeilii]
MSPTTNSDAAMHTGMARIPCSDNSPEWLCDNINDLLKSSRSVDEEGITEDLDACIEAELDFGTAYALLRSRWSWKCPSCSNSEYLALHNPTSGRCTCILCLYAKDEMGVEIPGPLNVISDPYNMLPRRIWDLYANRVVPFSCSQPPKCTKCSTITQQPPIYPFHAISHSWAQYRKSDFSEINQNHWEVPLPLYADIYKVREEMLQKIGAEYCWLDVLCLRQERKDKRKEKERQLEWATDVPTIGNVYQLCAGIMRYFNGLGVNFSEGSMIDSYHWLTRAWTLQEIRPESLMYTGAVDSAKYPIPLHAKLYGKSVPCLMLRQHLAPLAQLARDCDSPNGCSILELIRHMKARYASNDLDKITGISYLLKSVTLPVYDPAESIESAWVRGIVHIRYLLKLEILFNCPYARRPCTGEKPAVVTWIPTWKDLMTIDSPIVTLARPTLPPSGEPKHVHNSKIKALNVLEYHGGTALEYCSIRNVRYNEYVVTPMAKNSAHATAEFGFYSTHSENAVQAPQIPNGSKYVLVTHGNANTDNFTWVVCRQIDAKVNDLSSRSRQWADFSRSLQRGVKVLEKIGILMTDDSRVLLAPNAPFYVQKEPFCYFI